MVQSEEAGRAKNIEEALSKARLCIAIAENALELGAYDLADLMQGRACQYLGSSAAINAVNREDKRGNDGE